MSPKKSAEPEATGILPNNCSNQNLFSSDLGSDDGSFESNKASVVTTSPTNSESFFPRTGNCEFSFFFNPLKKL